MSKSPTSNQASSASLPAATLWLLDGGLISDGKLASFHTLLASDERHRLKHFSRTARAREFVLGRMLLRHAARHLLGPAARHVDVAERKHHAPVLSFSSLSPTPDFHFSISHSRGWIACMASTACAIGLDIENKMPARDVKELGAAAFDDAGREWLAGLDELRREEGFYRLWNNQEALYKLRGNFTQKTGQISCNTGWNCFAIEHSCLHIGVCAAQELTSFDIIELQTLDV
ncbi:4'-phosphopantetheinyl transferase family protein [Herbaspirillum hiltneri]|nr:4'-phosphopantetheinyl transferase superfamily protein [Herbaspirillum hiltneri]